MLIDEIIALQNGHLEAVPHRNKVSTMVSQKLGKRILALREKVVAHFNANNWQEAELLTGFYDGHTAGMAPSLHLSSTCSVSPR